jgi:hypothetical protein
VSKQFLLATTIEARIEFLTVRGSVEEMSYDASTTLSRITEK